MKKKGKKLKYKRPRPRKRIQTRKLKVTELEIGEESYEVLDRLNDEALEVWKYCSGLCDYLEKSGKFSAYQINYYLNGSGKLFEHLNIRGIRRVAAIYYKYRYLSFNEKYFLRSHSEKWVPFDRYTAWVTKKYRDKISFCGNKIKINIEWPASQEIIQGTFYKQDGVWKAVAKSATRKIKVIEKMDLEEKHLKKAEILLIFFREFAYYKIGEDVVNQFIFTKRVGYTSYKYKKIAKNVIEWINSQLIYSGESRMEVMHEPKRKFYMSYYSPSNKLEISVDQVDRWKAGEEIRRMKNPEEDINVEKDLSLNISDIDIDLEPKNDDEDDFFI